MFGLSDINRYCGTKLKLCRTEEARHINYDIRLENKAVPLPSLIRVSRGKGDIDNKNFAGIARALGLSEFELKESISCTLRRECVFLCLCVRLLQFIKMQMTFDPVVHGDGALAMEHSINTILSEIACHNIRKLTNVEKRLLSKRVKDLQSLQGLKPFENICRKLIGLIEPLLK